MPTYTVTLHNDMGHLVIDSNHSYIPRHIHNFVYLKAKMYLNCATDTFNKRCRFYILKPGVKKTWNYTCGSDSVIITFNVGVFNPKTMRMLR